MAGGTDSCSHLETGFPHAAVGRRSDSVAGETFCLTPATFSIISIVLSLGQAHVCSQSRENPVKIWFLLEFYSLAGVI